jgi:phosphoserine aminotransferase
MGERAWNFAAGPAALPVRVLEQIRDELLAYPGAGASVLEISHRSRAFAGVLEEAEANLRALLEVPDSHRVLFLQGGASLQFAMVPMNLLRGSQARHADHVVTGTWGVKAAREASSVGDVHVVWDGAADGYRSVPSPGEPEVHGDAAYLHYTSNETIQGVQWSRFPDGSGVPLVCDMSSDFLSRPVPVDRHAVIYAGAQKNAGPAGLTIVLVRDDVLERIPDGSPAILDYRTHARSGSLYNTPNTFGIYAFMLVTRWLRDEVGGLQEMDAINRKKADLLYEAIDTSDGFYTGHARADARSLMNVTFRLPDEELGSRFAAEAAGAGLLELKGHRSVGGIRASIYNAMPLEGVAALRAFMDAFRARA